MRRWEPFAPPGDPDDGCSNLIRCNDHFRGLATCCAPARTRGTRTSRSGAGSAGSLTRWWPASQVYRHPSSQQHCWSLLKLIDFHREHATAMSQVMANLDKAAGQVTPATSTVRGRAAGRGVVAGPPGAFPAGSGC